MQRSITITHKHTACRNRKQEKHGIYHIFTDHRNRIFNASIVWQRQMVNFRNSLHNCRRFDCIQVCLLLLFSTCSFFIHIICAHVTMEEILNTLWKAHLLFRFVFALRILDILECMKTNDTFNSIYFINKSLSVIIF